MKTKDKSTQTITAEEFDRRFDEGEDISGYVDWSSARRPGLETKRINLDVPAQLLERLDREATRRGVSRQSLIKVWLFERIRNETYDAWKIAQERYGYTVDVNAVAELLRKADEMREFLRKAAQDATDIRQTRS